MPAMAFAADEAAPATATENAAPTTATENAAPAATETATGLAQFTDSDSITNKEAVAVLVGLGVIDGMGDGTFQPAGDLTRAQASKLVATVVKSGDKSEIPAPTEDPFTDVAKDYWGAGAIKFGVDNGYINGMGDGTFHPDEQVTTAQLATMLDKLLGYSVEDINYNWPENAMAKAALAGLLKGVEKAADVNLNREEAAQMIFNALKANTKVKDTTTGSDSEIVDGNSNYQNVPNRLEDDYFSPARNTTQQLIEKYFPKAVFDTEGEGDVFGRPSTVWKNGKTKITEEVIKAPVLKYTAQEVSTDDLTKASEKLADDIDGYITTDQTELKTNGVAVIFGPEKNSDIIADRISQETGNGILVEVYANEKDTEISDIIVIDYNLDTVSTVNSKDGSITLKKSGKITKKADFYSQISSVSTEDYVLVAKKGNEVIDAYLPTSVDKVAVTKLTNASKDGIEDSKATIGGSEYTYGHDPLPSALAIDPEDLGTAYLDKYGYLVAYGREKAAAADWALLESVFAIYTNTEVGEGNIEWFAILVKEDGSIENVPLMYAYDSEDEKYDEKTVKIADDFMAEAVEDSNNWFLLSGKLVTYKEAAAGYKLDDQDTKSNKSWGIEEPKIDVQKNATNIDYYYLSKDLNVITVTGKKASELKASTDSKITNDIGKDEYKYVRKVIGNDKVVTAIYLVDAKNITTINVTNITGETSYDGNKKGITIEYYTDDSAQVQTGIVEEDGIDAVGWYTVEKIKDGMKVQPLDDEEYAEADVVADVTGQEDETSAYGSTLIIDSIEYELASDASVVSLDDTDIADVASLIDEIDKLNNNKDASPFHMEFTWTVKDNKKVVSQIYVKAIDQEQPADDQEQPANDQSSTEAAV